MADKTLGEQNYEQFAERYAELARTKPHNAEYDRPAVLSLVPDVQGKAVLDAGCGPGYYAEALLERGAILTAFDVTSKMVEITRERVGDRADVFRHDIMQPFHFADDNTYDLIICPLVLDYIEDWQPVLEEFHRVLKVGGMVIISHGHPMGDWLILHGKYPHLVKNYFDKEQFSITWGGFGEPRPTITSYRRPLSDMLNSIAQAGLQIDHVLEPLPTERFKELDPVGYEKLMFEPAFICFRLKKTD